MKRNNEKKKQTRKNKICKKKKTLKTNPWKNPPKKIGETNLKKKHLKKFWRQTCCEKKRMKTILKTTFRKRKQNQINIKKLFGNKTNPLKKHLKKKTLKKTSNKNP